VRSTIGIIGSSHGDCAALVAQAVGRLISNGRAAGCFSLQFRIKAAPLNHEVGNDAMEDGPVVSLVVYVFQKVLHRNRRLARVKFDRYFAHGGVDFHKRIVAAAQKEEPKRQQEQRQADGDDNENRTVVHRPLADNVSARSPDRATVGYLLSRRTVRMTTSSTGTFLAPSTGWVFTRRILSTTSMPSMPLPKTA